LPLCARLRLISDFVEWSDFDSVDVAAVDSGWQAGREPQALTCGSPRSSGGRSAIVRR
jgi:hypothetical protein